MTRQSQWQAGMTSMHAFYCGAYMHALGSLHYIGPLLGKV